MGRGPEWWTTLSPDQKRALTYSRLKEKESNQAIADAFGITPNSIASIRNRWNHANHRNPYTLIIRTESEDAEPETVEPSQPETFVETAPPEPERDFADPIIPLVAVTETFEPETGEASSVEESAPAEAGCIWPLAKSSSLKPEECGKEVVPGFRCCEQHAPLLYGKRFMNRN